MCLQPRDKAKILKNLRFSMLHEIVLGKIPRKILSEPGFSTKKTTVEINEFNIVKLSHPCDGARAAS